MALLLLSNCAFTNRVILMKEYSASLPASYSPGLQGKRVAVKVIDQRAAVSLKWTETSASPAPDGYKTRELTPDEKATWDSDLEERKAAGTEDNWHLVGWMRNGYGMHTADVYSVNPPSEWLREVLATEIEAQGGVVVEPEEAAGADVIVDATLRYLKVDIYMHNWATLVADFSVRGRGQPAGPIQTITTTGERMAWTSSSYGFYETFRECAQRAMWVLLPIVEQAAANPTPDVS